MAALTMEPYSVATGWTCAAAYRPYAGHALSTEGRHVEDEARRVIYARGPSEYVRRLLSGRTGAARTAGFPAAAALAGASFLALALAGLGSGLGDYLYPPAAVAGLISYSSFARWVAAQNKRTGLLGFAERVRRALAYQDSAPQQAK